MAAISSGKGQYPQALAFIQPVLASNPKFALAHLALSIILFNLGQLEKARVAAETAISIEPTIANGQAHLQTVKMAMESAQKVDNSVPPEVLATIGEGIGLQGQGEHANAIHKFQQALVVVPDNFMALYSLGVSLSAAGQSTEALEAFTRACDTSPHMAIGFFAKAKTYQDLGLAEAAVETYDKAIAVDPKYMEAYTNKAAVLQAINRHHDALLTLVGATEIEPNHVRSLEGQGLLLGQYKQYGLAVNAFRRALEVDPDYAYGEGHLMSARLSNCDWTDFETSRQRIFDGIRAGKRMCGPLTIMSLTDDAALARKCIEIYAADKYGESMYKLWNGEKYRHRRKRVAFISADFRTHPVGYLMIGMLEKFDRKHFEITGVFTGTADGSDLWKRYRCAFDHYVDVHDKPSLEVAKLLKAMEIDIAIDLSGHTEGTRLDVLSHRPCPVQATYLGFPGTLGLPYIDYLIADPQIIPPELQHNYKEKIVYLPHCYLPRDNSVIPSEATPSRSEFGLPESGVVFCSFNHDYKINPPMFKVWMELLKEVPDSVLWLMKLNEGAHINLTNQAISHGIDPNRIVYATRLPRIEDHLARYRLSDVFLDTYPYNGHTTAGDALRAGIPVVTQYGKSFASRVAKSLLCDVSLSNYALNTIEEYKITALRIANSRDEKSEVQYRLKNYIEGNKWPPCDVSQAAVFTNLISSMGAE
jgi:predicted O-linked N-acetylglucosamine transferase (SPINDLY family)